MGTNAEVLRTVVCTVKYFILQSIFDLLAILSGKSGRSYGSTEDSVAVPIHYKQQRLSGLSGYHCRQDVVQVEPAVPVNWRR